MICSTAPHPTPGTIRWHRAHGDVVVWGGPARLHYHGVLALKDGHHDLLGSQRLNLTFRRALQCHKSVRIEVRPA